VVAAIVGGCLALFALFPQLRSTSEVKLMGVVGTMIGAGLVILAESYYNGTTAAAMTMTAIGGCCPV
jgi:hypothetical protein